MMRYRLCVSAFALVTTLSTAAHAQDANAQRALQKAQFMLKQVSNDKDKLQSQVAALQQTVDQLTRELAATKSGAAGSLQKTEEKYSSAIAQWKQRDAETNTALAAAREQLKQQLAQRQTLEASLQRQVQNFSICYENNRRLYDINHELLDRYENKGFGDVLKQREPFTGVAKVDLENLVQDYRYRLDDLKIEPAQTGNN